MPHYIIVASVIFLLIILQFSFLANIFPGGGVADAALVAVIFWSARKGFSDSWRRAFLTGLILDLVYFFPPGVNIIALTITSFAVGSFSKRFLVSSKGWNLAMTMVLVIIGTVINVTTINLILDVINKFYKNGAGYAYYPLFSRETSYKVLLNIVFLGIIYWPLLRLEEHLSRGNKNLPITGKVFRNN